jgi:ribonuclease P protein component
MVPTNPDQNFPPAKIGPPAFRLRKHADYQRVYKASRKQFAKQMSYFFMVRPELGPDGLPMRGVDATGARVGLTVGKVREAVRRQLPVLRTPVDVVLHPKRSVIDIEFAVLEREIGSVFRAIEKMAGRGKTTADLRG